MTRTSPVSETLRLGATVVELTETPVEGVGEEVSIDFLVRRSRSSSRRFLRSNRSILRSSKSTDAAVLTVALPGCCSANTILIVSRAVPVIARFFY